MSFLLLLVILAVLLALGVPIAFGIGLATLATMLLSIDALPAVTTMAQRMASGLDSFALLAIPLFIISGNLMAQGGIAYRLIEFAKSLLGALPGGLAFVNVIACTLFGAISGSAVAAASAVGGFMIPAMKKDGYDKDFSTAVTATAATTGLLIPPSNILIIYAVASGGVSIAALFVAGYLPGMLVALALMVVSAFYARRAGLQPAARSTMRHVLSTMLHAFPSLLLIVIVIGGIIGGIFTATEAGAVAVLYSLFLALAYREVKLADLPDLLIKSAETTAIVMFLIAVSTAMSWILAYDNIPTLVSNALLSISDNPIVLLLLINLALLLVGAFLDMTPAVLIFTPIFLPIAVDLGMSPLHFGIMLVLNLCIGLCSPPVGSLLFVSSAIGKTSIGAIIRPLLPMYFAMFAVLMVVAYVPAVSEWLPRVLGLYE
ncbi:MAG TPA: TRAP transporter large permease [Woeseiaceae bacterium]|nr:TRAP transporter large permease [Woeseiaceae bacterium]